MRPMRLSIRRWLLCILILAVPCALWSWRLSVDARRREAIAEIARLGGSVHRVHNRGVMSVLPVRLAGVDLSGCDLSQCADLSRRLGTLATFETLDLSAATVNDDILFRNVVFGGDYSP